MAKLPVNSNSPALRLDGCEYAVKIALSVLEVADGGVNGWMPKVAWPVPSVAGVFFGAGGNNPSRMLNDCSI